MDCVSDLRLVFGGLGAALHQLLAVHFRHVANVLRTHCVAEAVNGVTGEEGVVLLWGYLLELSLVALLKIVRH